MRNENKIKYCGLCESRHEMPVSEFVFGKVIEDPTDLQALRETCQDFIHKSVKEGARGFSLYVTGMSVALAEFIRCCASYPIGDLSLELRHYDAKSGEYYTQPMWDTMEVLG